MMREQGRMDDAAKFEREELANTLRDLRLAHGPDYLPDSELRAMFLAEEKRVADAVVLSELLIPQLVKSFPPAAPVGSQVAAPAPVVSRSTSTLAPFEQAPTLPRAAAAGVSPMIADLLDAMLASERSGRRPLGAKT